VLISSQPSGLTDGDNTTFNLTGTSLYPCGLTFSVYKDDPENVVVDGIDVNVKEERNGEVVLNNSIFSNNGIYYGYFVFGPGLKNKTNAVVLFENPSKKGINLPLIILIGVGGLIIIVVIVVIILLILKRKKLKNEPLKLSVGKNSSRYIFFFYFYFYFLIFP
jgi:hypothetical protein